MNKDSFVFYRSFAEAIDDLPDQEQLMLYRAIKEYALNGNEPELTGLELATWGQMKTLINNHTNRRQLR